MLQFLLQLQHSWENSGRIPFGPEGAAGSQRGCKLPSSAPQGEQRAQASTVQLKQQLACAKNQQLVGKGKKRKSFFPCETTDQPTAMERSLSVPGRHGAASLVCPCPHSQKPNQNTATAPAATHGTRRSLTEGPSLKIHPYNHQGYRGQKCRGISMLLLTEHAQGAQHSSRTALQVPLIPWACRCLWDTGHTRTLARSRSRSAPCPGDALLTNCL